MAISIVGVTIGRVGTFCMVGMVGLATRAFLAEANFKLGTLRFLPCPVGEWRRLSLDTLVCPERGAARGRNSNDCYSRLFALIAILIKITFVKKFKSLFENPLGWGGPTWSNCESKPFNNPFKYTQKISL